jgi:hypothetical protein
MVTVRLSLVGEPYRSYASLWSVEKHFNLEVFGYGVVDSVILVLDESTECGETLAHARFLQGPLADGLPPKTIYSPTVTTNRWEGLRLPRGGAYRVCYCPPDAVCSWKGAFIELDIASPPLADIVTQFQVLGPGSRALQNDLGQPMDDVALPSAPQVNETFDLQVAGVNLTDLDRFRIVDSTTTCDGAAEVSSFLKWPSVDDDLMGETGSTGDDTTSRLWRGMEIPKVDTFRVCWCVGEPASNSYNLPELIVHVMPVAYDPNATNKSNTTGTSSSGTTSTRTFTTTIHPNGTNLTNQTTTTTTSTTTSSTTTSTTTSNTTTTTNVSMFNGSGTLQPQHFARRLMSLDSNATADIFANSSRNVFTNVSEIASAEHVLYLQAKGNASNESHSYGTFTHRGGAAKAKGNASNESHSYANFTHRGGAAKAGSTCSNATDFDVDLGVFGIAGPTGVAAIDDLTGKPNARVGRNFTLRVFGEGVSESGRIRLITPEGGYKARTINCGDPMSINNSIELEGRFADDPDSQGVANGSSVVDFDGLRLKRAGRYSVCWCSCRRTPCIEASQFRTTAGFFKTVWAGAHQILDANEEELRVLPGVEFTLQIGGIELTERDRVRIVETSVTCGREGASENTAWLRGPLTRVPSHSGLHTMPGVLTGPGHLREDRERLTWTGLRLYSGGVRRVCWCPGGGQSGAEAWISPECSRDRDFYYEVGTFDTIYIRQAWAEACARTQRPFKIHVAAVGLRPKIDRILLARSVDVCGEASPRGLKPYGVARDPARSDWGYPALISCLEDPNSAAAPGERKLVCGDAIGTVQVTEPGLYRICVCARAPGYDCTDASHYRIPAGELFEVAGTVAAASGAWQDVIHTSAAGGGATQSPLILNGPGAASLVGVYAPSPAPEAVSRLAVGSEDGVLRLWEPETPRMVSELVGHTGPVSTLAWSADSTSIVTGSVDGTMRLWKTAAGVSPGAEPAHICPTWSKIWKRPGGEATHQVLYDFTVGENDPLSPDTITGNVVGGDATDQEWQNAINYMLGSVVTRWLNLTDVGTASQSSVRHDAVAARAIDGSEDGYFATGSCTHTETQKDPWWHVELGGPYAVRGVKVSNRADCCGHWL